MTDSMSLKAAVAVCDLWKSAGGNRHVHIAAREPLLWRDRNYTPPDLVSALGDLDFEVSLTTNGSLLKPIAKRLKTSGLKKLRISWHTTRPDLFAAISGGAIYSRFMESVDAALESGVPVTFNRLLFRGYFDDLPSQIEFVEDHSLTLKLYDLLWTPEIADHYSEAYQGCMPVLEDYVIPRSRGSEIISDGWTRSRIRFHLPNGGCVEVKMGWNLDRSNPPCIVCPYSSMCSEQFGDYVRIEPDLHLYFCYLRRDIAIDIQDLLGINGARDKILKKLTSILGPRVEALLSKASLRLIVEPRCNFKCFFPGTHVSWCHKSKINGLSDRGLATRPNPL